MESSKKSSSSMMVVAVLVLVAAMAAAEQAGAICNMTSDGFDECKPSVTGPDPAEPSRGCCDALGAADLPCLCSYRNSVVLPSLGIDPGLAMQLPRKCGLPTPAGCEE
ncbi:PVR3-like protein [Iris pallida]|uniref:PVR3-like protein n=1 Tax=Iris pallida TaxID=29817 RepID=A0AAX6H1I5_IRIPA|nr:PVR3-like protein [Iris pallida]